jgi:hypothetical protein
VWERVAFEGLRGPFESESKAWEMSECLLLLFQSKRQVLFVEDCHDNQGDVDSTGAVVAVVWVLVAALAAASSS